MQKGPLRSQCSFSSRRPFCARCSTTPGHSAYRSRMRPRTCSPDACSNAQTIRLELSPYVKGRLACQVFQTSVSPGFFGLVHEEVNHMSLKSARPRTANPTNTSSTNHPGGLSSQKIKNMMTAYNPNASHDDGLSNSSLRYGFSFASWGSPWK